MAFKTNSFSEQIEKKHPKKFFVIRLIVSVFILTIGVYMLSYGIDEKAVPILMVALVASGAILTIIMEIYYTLFGR